MDHPSQASSKRHTVHEFHFCLGLSNLAIHLFISHMASNRLSPTQACNSKTLRRLRPTRGVRAKRALATWRLHCMIQGLFTWLFYYRLPTRVDDIFQILMHSINELIYWAYTSCASSLASLSVQYSLLRTNPFGYDYTSSIGAISGGCGQLKKYLKRAEGSLDML